VAGGGKCIVTSITLSAVKDESFLNLNQEFTNDELEIQISVKDDEILALKTAMKKADIEKKYLEERLV
jgi:hypothetical protein